MSPLYLCMKLNFVSSDEDVPRTYIPVQWETSISPGRALTTVFNHGPSSKLGNIWNVRENVWKHSRISKREGRTRPRKPERPCVFTRATFPSFVLPRKVRQERSLIRANNYHSDIIRPLRLRTKARNVWHIILGGRRVRNTKWRALLQRARDETNRRNCADKSYRKNVREAPRLASLSLSTRPTLSRVRHFSCLTFAHQPRETLLRSPSSAIRFCCTRLKATGRLALLDDVSKGVPLNWYYRWFC